MVTTHVRTNDRGITHDAILHHRRHSGSDCGYSHARCKDNALLFHYQRR